MATYKSKGNLGPKCLKTTGKPKTCKRKEPYKPLAHERRFIICYKLYKVIGHNRRCCLLDPTNAHKKTMNVVRKWLKCATILSNQIFFFVHGVQT